MSISSLQNRVRELIEPTLGRLGYDLVAVEWRGQVLRLVIDSSDGANMGDCVSVSHTVSPLIDAADPISGNYRLEVASPGIDRPVQKLDDFRRFIGYTVKLTLLPGYPRRRFKGELISVDCDDIEIKVDGACHTLSHDSIDRAQLVLTLEEYQVLGKGLPPVPEMGDPS